MKFPQYSPACTGLPLDVFSQADHVNGGRTEILRKIKRSL